MGYNDATLNIKKSLGGKNPLCPFHHIEMIAKDNHGRFWCPQCGSRSIYDRYEQERDFVLRKKIEKE